MERLNYWKTERLEIEINNGKVQLKAFVSINVKCTTLNPQKMPFAMIILNLT